MKYIIDIKNETPDEVINSWLAENNCSVIHTFNHFEKMYIVETDNPISVTDFMDRLVLDDHTTAVKLHAAAPLYTVDAESDDDWWKAVVINGVLEKENASVVRRGSGYAVYLMDSGVNDNHEDLTNTNVRHLFSHTDTMTDLNGHGTALASIIAGTRAGITSAEIVSVKVFEQGVPTLVSDIMKALDTVALDYLNNYIGKPAVINMSWSIDRNEFVEDKLKSLLKVGLIPVTAAGNSGVPIQNVTPAAMAEVATIGSVGPNLTPSDFSNYTGPTDVSFTGGETNHSTGLDYWAPGEYILAASKNGGFTYIAGTSAATAVVSAIFAYQFSRLAVEYGKTYVRPVLGFLDQFMDSYEVTATIDSLTSVLITPYVNPFIPSRQLVDLTEKYKDCTNRIPTISRGLYDDQLDPNQAYTYNNVIHVKKGVPVNLFVYDPMQLDSASIVGLPDGLILNPETGFITGLMDIEVGEDKFKVFNGTLTVIRGTKTIESPFQVIYLDMAVITDDFTELDYQDLVIDSNIMLQAGQCWKCGYYLACVGSGTNCEPCSPCADGKTQFEYCLNIGENCP